MRLSYLILIVLLLCARLALAGETPGSVTYHSFPSGTPGFSSVQFGITVNKDPGDQANVFWSNQFMFKSGTVAYIGLQSYSAVRNVFLFSVWNASAVKAGSPGTDCHSFSGEGIGQTCRLNFDWIEGHKYLFILTHEGNRWWGATIKDATSGVSFKLGSILTDSTEISKDNMMGWTEYFEWSSSRSSCYDQPYSAATFDLPVGWTSSGRVTATVGATSVSKACAFGSKVEVTASGTKQTNAIGNSVRGPISYGGSCADSSQGISEGAKAILYSCHGGGNQAFVLSVDHTIRMANGYCLAREVSSSKLKIQTCSGSNLEKWQVLGSHIRNLGTPGKCLTRSSVGAQLTLERCQLSNVNQVFSLPQTP